MTDTIASLLALDVPNLLPDWHFFRPAGRLIWSSVILVVAIGAAFAWVRRPKRSDEPATWAATIAGAIVVTGLMTLAYGVWPHEFLTFANSYLNWGKDTYFVQENQFLGGSFPPIDIPRYVIADIIAAGSYFVFGAINVYLFAAWQKRKVAEPAAVASGPDTGTEADTPGTGPFARLRRRGTGTSAYGRPITTTES